VLLNGPNLVLSTASKLAYSISFWTIRSLSKHK